MGIETFKGLQRIRLLSLGTAEQIIPRIIPYDVRANVRPMSKSRKSFIPDLPTATLERGEAKYFHGRGKILDNFKKLMDRAVKAKAGTTVVIQAAPGAGKTALLAECARIAEERRWQTTDIAPDEFFDPAELSKALRLPLPAKRQETTTGGSIQVLHGESISEHHLPTTLDILESGREPLLLLLDEAQTIAAIMFRSRHDQFKSALKFVTAIHNGKIKNRPVVLIAAGLGATAEAFDSLGISRFDPGCEINLEPLSERSRRAVIETWLKKDGGVKGDPAEWVEAIAPQTHGWPQHIMAYVWTALTQLKLTDGELTPEGLETVLKEGRKGRITFYESRVAQFESRELCCIASAVADVPLGERINKEKVMDSLLQSFSEEKAEEIFERALHKGVFDRRKNDYVIPIPSMHDWLVFNYSPNRERIPEFNWYLVARMTESEIKARTDDCTFNEDPAILLPKLISDALEQLPPPISGQEWVFDAVDVDTENVIWTADGRNKTMVDT